MFHQFVTPVTTKLSFTNASNPQKSTNPVSTISFYSNTTNTPTIENVPYSSTQRTFPTSDSWNENLLKSPIYFDYPTPPNPSVVERTFLTTFNHTQDTFRLEDTSVSTYPSTYISTTYNCSQDLSINSPTYCPKSPVYITKAYDIPQKIPIESPIFYPSSPTTPTTPTNFSKVHNSSFNSPQHYPHQVLNDSLEVHSLSPISISAVNELKRSTLSEKKGNSIEQSNSIGKIKFNKILNDDEQENKENSLGESFKINNDVIDVDESISESIRSDFDVTMDVIQTPAKSQPFTTNPSIESSTRGKKGLVRRSNRLAVKPALNYRV